VVGATHIVGEALRGCERRTPVRFVPQGFELGRWNVVERPVEPFAVEPGLPPVSWRAVEELLERMPDLSLTDPEEPAHRPANFVSGYEGLGVRFGASAPATT
jgi:hypothetical protein